MSIVIRIAEEKDLLPIQRLVAKAGLSDSGIEQQVENFLVAEDDKKIVGTIGIEKVGVDGLLRSLVMQSDNWNAKIGLEFVQLALAYAEKRGIETLYLLTKQSTEFFEYLGFKEVGEQEVPKHLKESPHFSQFTSGVTKVLACRLKEE
ncbi:GNAT family N-acetyltransferase [Desertibacillus haloalkaliphilus]|uniref:GNAT family N-acetyltransferase n=1 Tax=Desertibacillus haloalkaliphilus TaxID=1328930 RepID=UPI001C25EA92|nr:GNAT family N-acetyltransferase [Desertibacillus haloalkaliphilus]MBU8905871.1 GNAT family N-acetyltransferase [Desertibacillus haloalkaliphilus]